MPASSAVNFVHWLLAALPLLLVLSPIHDDLVYFVTLADAHQFVALEGIVLPRMPTADAAEDGAAHVVLAPVVVTMEHYSRVLEAVSFQTVLEIGFQAFCEAYPSSIPVRQCFCFNTMY